MACLALPCGIVGCITPRLKLSRPTNNRLNAGFYVGAISFLGDCDDKERTLYLQLYSMVHRPVNTILTRHFLRHSTNHNLSLLYLNGKVGRFSIFSLSAATVVMSLPQKRKKVVWFRT